MRSLLRPFLLLLIQERPGHGYELIERLAALGLRDVEPGQVYRALRSLERERSVVSVWVTSPAGPARRRYEITGEGLAALRGWAAHLGHLHAVVGSCLARLARAGSPPRPAPGEAAPRPALAEATPRPAEGQVRPPARPGARGRADARARRALTSAGS